MAEFSWRPVLPARALPAGNAIGVSSMFPAPASWVSRHATHRKPGYDSR
jgi:hypothetical protein